MARRIGLGKGLDALLDNNDYNSPSPFLKPLLNKKKPEPDDEPPHVPLTVPPQDAAPGSTPSQSTVQLPVDKLVPGQGQPRKNFDETEMQELAASIKEYGVIQPVIAANAGDGTYIIIAGERRTRAAKMAGLKTVPAIIREYTDQKRLEVSLVENIQRSDLNPMEEAAAYKNLMDFSRLSQDELASRVGKNRSTIANALRLLKLPAEIQKSIERGKISPGHARALLSLENVKAREKLFGDILAGELSVREAEKRAAVLSASGKSGAEKPHSAQGAKKPAAKTTGRPPEVNAMEEKFIGALGTKVVIDGDLNWGKILIDYYSMEDLERLYEILGG